MTEHLYVVFDRVANARTGGVVVARNDASVTRSFHDLLARDDGFRAHAGDYELRCVGSLDDLGNVVAIPPVTVATGAQWAATQRPTLLEEKIANA